MTCYEKKQLDFYMDVCKSIERLHIDRFQMWCVCEEITLVAKSMDIF